MWTPSTLTLDFGADHSLMESALRQVVDSLPGEPARAREMYFAYNERLRGHMRVEERLLFEPFERQTGMREAGPTVVLARTHRHIYLRLDELTQAFNNQAGAQAIMAQMEQLRALVKDQSDQEESVVLPSCDQLLEPKEVQEALAALHALPTLH